MISHVIEHDADCCERILLDTAVDLHSA